MTEPITEPQADDDRVARRSAADSASLAFDQQLEKTPLVSDDRPPLPPGFATLWLTDAGDARGSPTNVLPNQSYQHLLTGTARRAVHGAASAFPAQRSDRPVVHRIQHTLTIKLTIKSKHKGMAACSISHRVAAEIVKG